MSSRTSSRKPRPVRRALRPAEPLLRLRPASPGKAIRPLLRRLPPLEGAPIHLGFRPSLWAWRGRLRAGPPGSPVHAATFIRTRRILLETALLRNPSELARILIHELFHFVWVRLGNPARRSWEALIQQEFRAGARGELGYSALWRKQALQPGDRQARTRRWREYACESFSDSAAWCFGGQDSDDEFTLGSRWRLRRRRWLARLTARAPLPV